MNFADLLENHRVEHFTGGRYCRPGWVQFFCPFCSGSATDPGKPTCGYNTTSRAVNCWVCGRHRLGDTIVALTGLGWRDVKPLLGALPRQGGDTAKPPGRLVLPVGVGPLWPAHEAYLRGRGLDPATLVRLWGIGGIAIAPRLQWRLFVPIHKDGAVVSWVTRSISNNPVGRYISADETEEAYPHKKLLYGEDYARHAIIIVEGPVDVWRIGPGAVCTFGTGLKDAQLRAAAKYAEIAVCFDSEPKAQARARRLCDDLAAYGGRVANVTLAAKDPGSATDAEIRDLRAACLGVDLAA